VTLAIAASHATLLANLRAAGHRFVVIGAIAVSHHVGLERETFDVDLVLVAAPNDVDSILRGFGWERHPKIRQRWVDAEGMRVDVIQATPELLKAGQVRFDDDDKELSLVGFDLALKHVSPVPVHDGRDVDVVDLAPLIVLKMVSWLDRPNERQRDLGDIVRLLRGALAEDDLRRWEPPLDEVEFDLQAPAAAGLAVAAVATDQHRAKASEFLRAVMDASMTWLSVMAREAAIVGDDPDLKVQTLLTTFATHLGIDAPHAD
jgi:predicted nucleotidyltransferase